MKKKCGCETCSSRRVHHERPDENRSHQEIEVPDDHVGTVFCSYECAMYAGYYSARDGWIKDPRTGEPRRKS